MENKIKVLELFAGIGAPHKALTNIGANYEIVDIVEFDEKAVKSYNAIHGTNFIAQDITTWNKNIKVNHVHASTPCQAFSQNGLNIGAEDKRGAILWEHTIRIIKLTKPETITLENVKGLLSAKHKPLRDWYLNELSNLGYETDYFVANAVDYGVPQNRERVFFISRNDGASIEFPINQFMNLRKIPKIMDILDKKAEWNIVEDGLTIGDKFYFENKLSQYKGKTIEIDLTKLNNQMFGKINKVAKIKIPLYKELNTNLDIPDLAFNSAKNYYGVNGVNGAVRASADAIHEQKILATVSFNEDSSFMGVNGVSVPLTATNCVFKQKILNTKDNYFAYRKLTPLEITRLMGFDDEDYKKILTVNSNSAIIKQLGNSIVVPVMEAIFNSIFDNDNY